MARIVIHTAKRPYRHVTERGEEVWICTCGLSDTYPICSGKHRLVAREDDSALHVYDQNGNAIGTVSDQNLLKLLENVKRV
jgi:CDGSH-type Zn-finger protein